MRIRGVGVTFGSPGLLGPGSNPLVDNFFRVFRNIYVMLGNINWTFPALFLGMRCSLSREESLVLMSRFTI